MLKKQIIVMVIIILLTLFTFGTKIIDLTDQTNPGSIYLNGDRIYIVENISIYIYSLDDFKLIKKFGKAGEGPQEFKHDTQSNVSLILSFDAEKIIVYSRGKLSFFTKNGDFIKEIKVNNGKWYKQLGKNFVGLEEAVENNITYATVNLYDPDLKKIKELLRKKNWFQQNSKMSGVDLGAPEFEILGDRVIGSNGDLLIFDSKGNKTHTLDYKFKKKKVTKKNEIDYRNWMKKSPVVKPYYENLIKPKLVFPDYFPEIKNIGTTDKNIYVSAYKNKDQIMSDIFFFDLNGKFIKKVKLPVKYIDVFTTYPFEIYKGKFYQLIENEEEENWQLHITDIK